MRILVATTALALLAVPALSEAQTIARSSVYGTLGYASSHADGLDLGAVQARVGYRLNPWLGVEGELTVGAQEDRSITPSVDGSVTFKSRLQHEEAIYGVGFLPLSQNFDLLARIGYGEARVKSKTEVTTGASPPFIGHQTRDGDAWSYGAGGQYRWDAENGVRADYTHQAYNGGQLDHADVWSVAYVRRF